MLSWPEACGRVAVTNALEHFCLFVLFVFPLTRPLHASFGI